MGTIYLPFVPISCHITQPGHFLWGWKKGGPAAQGLDQTGNKIPMLASCIGYTCTVLSDFLGLTKVSLPVCLMQVSGGGKAKGATTQIAWLRRRMGKMDLSWQTAVMLCSKVGEGARG